ncbi:hypothetical protein U8M15_27540, partial [Klebsiella pneumoniae]|uniref:hypothetical protein n=1 Tax=Klebsiella pneumoniae TaxID=573 RepID=UPI002AE02E95
MPTEVTDLGPIKPHLPPVERLPDPPGPPQKLPEVDNKKPEIVNPTYDDAVVRSMMGGLTPEQLASRNSGIAAGNDGGIEQALEIA